MNESATEINRSKSNIQQQSTAPQIKESKSAKQFITNITKTSINLRQKEQKQPLEEEKHSKVPAE